MNRSTFETRLQTAAQQAVGLARDFVQQHLPDKVAFLVFPNQSCDEDARVGDEVVFPSDSLTGEQYYGPWQVEEVVNFLWRDGKVPEWIDTAVKAEDGGRTLVSLHCCGRFTAQEELLYHRYQDGIPPFSIKSPYLPPGWESLERSGKFDLCWQEQLARRNKTCPT